MENNFFPRISAKPSSRNIDLLYIYLDIKLSYIVLYYIILYYIILYIIYTMYIIFNKKLAKPIK